MVFCKTVEDGFGLAVLAALGAGPGLSGPDSSLCSRLVSPETGPFLSAERKLLFSVTLASATSSLLLRVGKTLVRDCFLDGFGVHRVLVDDGPDVVSGIRGRFWFAAFSALALEWTAAGILEAVCLRPGDDEEPADAPEMPEPEELGLGAEPGGDAAGRLLSRNRFGLGAGGLSVVAVLSSASLGLSSSVDSSVCSTKPMCPTPPSFLKELLRSLLRLTRYTTR